MKQYHDHLKWIKEHGVKKRDRTGTGTLSVFGYQNRYDLSKGFPIETTKEVKFDKIVTELLWFLKGYTNIKYLHSYGVNIWDEDAYNYYVKLMKEKYPDKPYLIHDFKTFLLFVDTKTDCNSMENYQWGDCGKQYGWLWRSLGKDDESSYIKLNNEIDQVANVINDLKNNPESRRIIINAWNPATLDQMALYPCHAFVQFYTREIPRKERFQLYLDLKSINGSVSSATCEDVSEDFLDNKFDFGYVPKYYLDCQMYQRSADMFLGVPFNISSYSLLTHIIAGLTNMKAGEFIHTFGDSHIYLNHLEQVNTLLSRDPEKYSLPKLQIGSVAKNMINDYKNGERELSTVFNDLVPKDFRLEGYESYPEIKAPLNTGMKKEKKVCSCKPGLSASLTTFSEILDKYIGKVGSKERDKFEQEIKEEVDKYGLEAFDLSSYLSSNRKKAKVLSVNEKKAAYKDSKKMEVKDVAKKYGVSERTVYRIKSEYGE